VSAGAKALKGLTWKWAILLLGVVAAAEGVYIASVYRSERVMLRSQEKGLSINPGSGDNSWRKFEFKGVHAPPTLKADESGLADDEVVIGVEAGGKARAYRLSAFLEVTTHVVNDLVGGVPVSVAYCDVTDCVQVYTDPGESAPLDIRNGGLADSGMVLIVGGVYYKHTTGQAMEQGAAPAELPLSTLPASRLTWKEWKGRHPDTDVYIGVNALPQKGPAAAVQGGSAPASERD
jgi:hypothetical protein